MLKLGTYFRIDRTLLDLNLSADYIAVEENLKRDGEFGIIVPDSNNTVYGTVLKIPKDIKLIHDIRVGDKVIFKEWEGGRWAFDDPDSDENTIRCLILSSDYILAVIR